MAPTKNKTFIFSIMLVLGLWLIALLFAASWFQRHYIHSFTEQQPEFLKADYTDHWFNQLKTHLPPKNTHIRVIQFWQPNCLCNRFARPHALATQTTAKALSIEHLTVIPSSHTAELKQLQSLNPDTQLVSLDKTLMASWPASPSVFVEGPLSTVQYFGPLGFGAFCSQASTGIIENQLQILDKSITQNPTTTSDSLPKAINSGFYNVIGKGCFCPWG